MPIIISKFIFEVIHMFNDILVWIVAILFLIGLVMTLEKRLSGFVGLFLICCTSIFFVYYFSFFRALALCTLFGVITVISVRYLLVSFKDKNKG